MKLTWEDLLKRDFIRGIPNFYKGKILNIGGFDKKDEKNLVKGDIHIFPRQLIKQLKHLKSRTGCTAGVRIEFKTSARYIEVNAEFPKVATMANMSSLAQRSIDVSIDGR
ncbi:MAG: hypothetical protein GF364_11945, partial [Candidatus Lokiarchaeota archaeon]|nr:hypothetical protein [Candidatus Lokiarchaeota archaeon]